MTGKRGAPKGNNNATRHGRYAKLSLLTCNRCFISKDCPSFNPSSVCAYEKARKSPSLESVEDVLNMVKEMLRQDYLRYQRQLLFERHNSGILDVDTIKLGQNITKEAELAARLSFLIEDRKKENIAPTSLINITTQETNLQLMEAIRNASAIGEAINIEPDRS